MSRSVHTTYTKLLCGASQNRLTCKRLNSTERCSVKASSPFAKASFTLIGPVWRTATEASDVSSASPSAPLIPPFCDLLMKTVMPSIFWIVVRFDDDFMIRPDQLELRVETEPTLCGFGPHDVSAAADPITNTVTIPTLHFTFDFCVIATIASPLKHCVPRG